MGSLLDTFESPLGTVYNTIKLFEIIANCTQSSSDPYPLKPILPLLKVIFLMLQQFYFISFPS